MKPAPFPMSPYEALRLIAQQQCRSISDSVPFPCTVATSSRALWCASCFANDFLSHHPEESYRPNWVRSMVLDLAAQHGFGPDGLVARTSPQPNPGALLYALIRFFSEVSDA